MEINRQYSLKWVFRETFPDSCVLIIKWFNGILTNVGRVCPREQVAETGGEITLDLPAILSHIRLFSAPQSPAEVTMRVLGQILHMEKGPFYIKNLQRMIDDIPILEPA